MSKTLKLYDAVIKPNSNLECQPNDKASEAKFSWIKAVHFESEPEPRFYGYRDYVFDDLMPGQTYSDPKCDDGWYEIEPNLFKRFSKKASASFRGFHFCKSIVDCVSLTDMYSIDAHNLNEDLKRIKFLQIEPIATVDEYNGIFATPAFRVIKIFPDEDVKSILEKAHKPFCNCKCLQSCSCEKDEFWKLDYCYCGVTKNRQQFA